MKKAIYQKPGENIPVSGAYNESLSYDKNGNIMSLQRFGGSDAPSIIFQIDDLTYDYSNANSNQLSKVTDSPIGNDNQGFIDGNKAGDDFSYDANGNLITDKNKNITGIVYNHLNLPVKITFGTGNSIAYIYNATGLKLEKKVTDNGIITETKYLGGYQYKDNVLQFFPTAEGYVEPNGSSFKYVFQYKDHLGNVRLSYGDADKNGAISSAEIIEESNYYPFGLKHSGYNSVVTSTNPAQKYKYNGKELQDELRLNMYDYGARNYDPALGRWMNIDPLAETSRRFSPYTYALNNPVFFIDPDGMQADDWIQKKGEDGKSTMIYDSAVTSQAEAAAKYGENAKHMDEGSTLTGTKGGETAYQYTFHDNGTVSNEKGETLSTKENTKTEGGTTIIGSDRKSGFKISYGLNGALGGGWGFDAGIVKDSGGSIGFFLSSNSNVGFGADTGFSFGTVKSKHSGPFLLEDAGGQSLSASIGVETPVGGLGLNYGGTFSSSLSPAQKLNLANYGTSDTGRGNIEGSRSFVTSPSAKISAGAMYRKSNVSVWQLN